jgi:hypothetical protein
MKITPLRLALAAGIIAVGAGAFATSASAAPAQGSGTSGSHRFVQVVSTLTDDQKQCLQDAGVTRPGADATPEERQAAREAFRAAAETCGITLPDPKGPLANLTDEQKTCLEAAGLTRPGPDATFEERQAARAALKAAAEGCGITLPERPAGTGPLANLTDEQKSCLEAAGLTRPGADATPEERQAARAALKAAAEGCGITLPERPAGTGPLANLTDEQKSCLEAAGLTRPGADATPEERQAARAALKAAAEGCGIELPVRPAA